MVCFVGLCVVFFLFFFFFKQKTAYDMRISDWSSDVCSSDLQLTCVFVDHGLMRQGEAEQVVSLFRGAYNIPLVHVNAETLFLNGLKGVTDPEAKRKFIGRTFIDVFEEEARKIGGADFLAQGTLYPEDRKSTRLNSSH